MPKFPKDYAFYLREFMNRPGHHAGAYVIFKVRDPWVNEDSYLEQASVTSEITDCNGRIYLSFSMGNREDRENSIHKARFLSRAFGQLAVALEKASEATDELEQDENVKHHYGGPRPRRRRRRATKAPK